MNVPAKQMMTPTHMLMDPVQFDQIIRIGDMLASSVLFPEHLRKGSAAQAKANGALVMNMAVRLNEDPLTVAQSIFFVGGRPGWHTQYMIAKANQHGTFSDQIDWEVNGKGDDLSVTAFATLARTGRKVSMTCDMDMAKAENWVKNPKYKSMPEVMLRYRSAAFLIRMYAPEVMVGIPMQVEIELEMKDVTPAEAAMQTRAETEKAAPPEPEDAVLVDDDEATAEGDLSPEGRPAEDEKAEQKPTSREKPKDDGADKSSDKPEPRDPAALAQTMSAIKGDLLDAGADNIDSVLEFYGDQVAEIRNDAPDLHEDLVEYIEQIKKGAEA